MYTIKAKPEKYRYIMCFYVYDRPHSSQQLTSF